MRDDYDCRVRSDPAVGREPVHRRHGRQHECEPAADDVRGGGGYERLVSGGAALQDQDVAEAAEPEHAHQTPMIFTTVFTCKNRSLLMLVTRPILTKMVAILTRPNLRYSRHMVLEEKGKM